MFWNKFVKLCEENNTKPNPLGKELGFSSGVITKWKNGSLPSTDALIKISDRFGVSIDYLVSPDEEKEHKPIITNVQQQIVRGRFRGYKGFPKKAKSMEDLAKIALMSQSTINFNNPVVANAYNNLSEDKQLEVQAYIMKLKNQKEPT